MKLVICHGESSNVESILSLGPRHPAFGAFLDCGTSGTVMDCATDPSCVSALEGHLSDELRAAGQQVHKAEIGGLGEIASGNAITWIDEPIDVAGTGDHLTALHQIAAHGVRVSLLILDRDHELAPVWLLSSFDLPCMGSVPPCSSADLVSTWLLAADLESAGGKNLLGDGSGVDMAQERDLAARLKQLYGADY